MRSIYETEMRDIQRDTIRMCNLAQEALMDVMEAVRRRDFVRIEKVHELDDRIREMRMEINERVMRLVATQHPVAQDLRRLFYFVHVAEEMEYIGYETVVTGKCIRRTQYGKIPLLEDIYRMCERIDTMFQRMLASVLGGSRNEVEEIVMADDDVDVLYEQISRECVARQNNENIGSDLMMAYTVAEHVEHIGDRIVNWGRWYLYFLSDSEENIIV